MRYEIGELEKMFIHHFQQFLFHHDTNHLAQHNTLRVFMDRDPTSFELRVGAQVLDINDKCVAGRVAINELSLYGPDGDNSLQVIRATAHDLSLRLVGFLEKSYEGSFHYAATKFEAVKDEIKARPQEKKPGVTKFSDMVANIKGDLHALQR